MLAQAHIAGSMFTSSKSETYDGFDKARTELRTIKPVTPEDYMCRGFALAQSASAQSIADLDKAIELRDSPIARTFRALTLGFIAHTTRDQKLCERALDDIRKAKKRLPDTPVVQFTNCQVHLTAAGFDEDAGQFKKQEATLAAAKDDALALGKQPINGHVMVAYHYLEALGEEDGAFKLLKEASEREETKELVTSYAQALYRRNQVEEALKVLDDNPQPGNRMSQLLRIFLLAEV